MADWQDDGSDLGSEDFSHYELSEASEVSTITDLLNRFTVDARPECVLKLRGRAGPAVVGADLSYDTNTSSTGAALVIKPSRERWWRRLRCDQSGTLTLRSQRIPFLKVFSLNLEGHANPFTRRFDFSYTIATKWDLPRGEYRNKRRHQLGDNTEARAHWTVAYAMPTLEGSMGTVGRGVSHEERTDIGYAHLRIPRLELVLWPTGRPAGAAAEPAERAEAPGGGSAACDDALGAAAGGAVEGGAGETAAAAAAPAALSSDEQPPWEACADLSQRGERGAAQRRSAALTQLGSHVASISGRWWDACHDPPLGGAATWKRR